MSGGSYDVFISYNRADIDPAEYLNSRLSSEGLSTFFDRERAHLGRRWIKIVEDAIDNSGALVLLIGKSGLGDTQQYERQLAVSRQLRGDNFSIVPILLPDCMDPLPLSLLPLTWVDLRHLRGGLQDQRFEAELDRLLENLRNPVRHERVRTDRCPYKGLEPFDEADASFFCGRDNLIDDLATKVICYPAVAVVGRSGSGKSSIVRAGLIPKLRQQRGPTWEVVSLTPGREPLRSLLAALESSPETLRRMVTEPDVLDRKIETLRTGRQRPVHEAVRAKLENSNFDALLMFVDQWEELYAVGPDADDKKAREAHEGDVEHFIQILLDIVSENQSRVKLVFSVRGDFYPLLLSDHRIHHLLPKQQVNIGQMSRSELFDAIHKPATQVGLKFVPESLIETILDDVGTDEGMLPLLQYALKNTWEQKTGTQLTEAGYNSGGGVRQAMQITADRIYFELSEDQKLAARRLFLRLVNPGEGQADTRARSPMPDDPVQRHVIEKFADRESRLLVTGFVPLGGSHENRAEGPHIPTVEIAHDALIRTWPVLRAWVDTNRARLRERTRIEKQMQEWARAGELEDMLLSPAQVSQARELLDDPGDVEVDSLRRYIWLSHDREQRLDNERIRTKAMEYASDIEAATSGLFLQNEKLKDFCIYLRRRCGFDLVYVQLKDKERKTIETLSGDEEGDRYRTQRLLETESARPSWYSLGKHSYAVDHELWDIQADIVAASCPRIEIITGQDRRFDEFIFTKFAHDDVTRVFAPIIFAWDHGLITDANWKKVHATANTDSPTDRDRREVFELSQDSYNALKKDRAFEIIGTVEAGYYRRSRIILPAQAERLVVEAAAKAKEIREVSLGNVFSVIARSAMKIVNADSASIHFAFDAGSGHYIYEEWAGARYRNIVSPRQAGLGLRALAEQQAMIMPDRSKGETAEDYRTFFPEAYEEGVRAQAAIPIFPQNPSTLDTSSGEDATRARSGILYVRKHAPHFFSADEIEWLTYFANRARDAIRQATLYSDTRDTTRRLVGLLNVAQALADDPRAANLLHDIAGHTLHLFGADVVTVYEYDIENGTFDRDSGFGGRLLRPDLAKARVDADSAPFRLVAAGQSLYAENARQDRVLFSDLSPYSVAPRFIDREKIKSAAGILLRASREIVGLMFVNYRVQHGFSTEEQGFADLVAATAANAIRIRRLLQGRAAEST